MGHRDITPVHVPLRTSSRNPARHDPMNTQEQSRIADRRASKAQRFFGTDISLPKEHGGWQEPPDVQRPSFLKPVNSVPRQNSGFVPFPSSSDNALIPDQNLRVRASSPLLGHDYRSLEAAPPLPKPSKKVHHSGSSSTLFSYFSSKESTKSAKSQGLQPRVRHGLSIEPQVTYTQAQDPPKESKRKMRPPKIDLSVLFPKPRNPAPQTLLSPHRMVNSPSPVSTVAPDSSSNKFDRISGTSNSTRRYVDVPPRSSTKNDLHPPKHVDNSDLPSIAESKTSEWSDQPLERTVGTSEIDLALDRYAARRSLLSRSSMYTNSREKLQPEQQRPEEPRKSSRRARSPSRPKETYLTPASCPGPIRGRGVSTSQESWKTNESKSKSEKSSVTKKSSKSTLKNKDLRNVSILCLSSSSEDEGDEDQTPITESKRNTNKVRRDSVATYGEYEPEVYTASTAQATTATAVRRFDRTLSTSTRGSHQTEKSQPVPVPVARPRKVSESSNSKSSQTTRRTTQTRRSSGVPTIPDDILAQFPQQPLRSPAELKELNRRSRVIAVTRQEQDLLEAMRIRKGKVTPSLFNAHGADRRSLASGPSRDSFCGSDTSFLRLSNVFPPFDVRSEKSVTQYKDGSLSQSSGSDSERKPRTTVSSSGFSADYSESLPSPSTSGASPMTPTLPIHRFSPLPSPKPPPSGPPPAIPEDQKQHTRRRTDSSEAILLDGGESKRSHDLPLWSFDFDWNKEHTNVAPVH
ncbi:hypothetical protein N7491_003079 [Penicillium cf. griseofulvum]|uniref:Uncharacterized protein n=1 Tax=Penicillium cf. griseofulvum TaxID=2972120 RepID=A0A9W9MS38_9EURO|nr:hypothetical protein N7472_002750 [Penicillium cf. griseofulvum]KAJ5440673.1 hypothetical protein N7491_003079 [Penicillium cf. griseofulvum]